MGRALQSQLLQVRAGGKRQSQGHTHPVHQLSGMQIQPRTEQRQLIAPQAQQLCGAAGEMERQQVPRADAAVQPGRGDVAPLMGGLKAGDAESGRQ